MHTIPNSEMMKTASRVLSVYDLPDGVQVSGLYGEVTLSYVFLEDDPVGPMRRISNTFPRANLYTSGLHVVLEAVVEAVGTHIRAQKSFYDTVSRDEFFKELTS